MGGFFECTCGVFLGIFYLGLKNCISTVTIQFTEVISPFLVLEVLAI